MTNEQIFHAGKIAQYGSVGPIYVIKQNSSAVAKLCNYLNLENLLIGDFYEYDCTKLTEGSAHDKINMSLCTQNVT